QSGSRARTVGPNDPHARWYPGGCGTHPAGSPGTDGSAGNDGPLAAGVVLLERFDGAAVTTPERPVLLAPQDLQVPGVILFQHPDRVKIDAIVQALGRKVVLVVARVQHFLPPAVPDPDLVTAALDALHHELVVLAVPVGCDHIGDNDPAPGIHLNGQAERCGALILYGYGVVAILHARHVDVVGLHGIRPSHGDLAKSTGYTGEQRDRVLVALQQQRGGTVDLHLRIV